MTNLNEESCLAQEEQDVQRPVGRAVWRAFRMLPLRERSLLKLVYERGATHAELAGALGMSKGSLRRTLSHAIERATDPLHIQIVACWNQLLPREQRLVYLHRVLGIPLRQIARDGLVQNERTDGRTGPSPCLASLRKEMRAIERKVCRLRGDQGTSAG